MKWSLTELNSTMHGLVHFGWVRIADGDDEPRMAVYVKHRGLRGRLYMRLIGPFRHWIVYPTLLRAVAERWRAEATAAMRSRGARVQAILHDG